MPRTTQPPAYIAYHIPPQRGAPWTRIGAVWPHKDGKGFALTLELLPPQPGRIQLRLNEPKADAAASEGGEA